MDGKPTGLDGLPITNELLSDCIPPFAIIFVQLCDKQALFPQ
jgi:hypothetical protein